MAGPGVTARAAPNRAGRRRARATPAQPERKRAARFERAGAERRRPPGSAPRPAAEPRRPLSHGLVSAEGRRWTLGSTKMRENALSLGFLSGKGLRTGWGWNSFVGKPGCPRGRSILGPRSTFVSFRLPAPSRAPASTELPASVAVPRPLLSLEA